MNFVNLVKFIVTREQRKERDDFKHDTSNSPEVHLVPVVAISKQALRRTVPPGANVFSVRLFGVNSTTRTKVSQLDLVLH
jgi:hypothetical protein